MRPSETPVRRAASRGIAKQSTDMAMTAPEGDLQAIFAPGWAAAPAANRAPAEHHLCAYIGLSACQAPSGYESAGSALISRENVTSRDQAVTHRYRRTTALREAKIMV